MITIEKLKEIFLNNENNNLPLRESKTVEFKSNFNMANIKDGTYLKTMAAFANSDGGIIIFGVTDRPRTASGMSNDNFEKIKIEEITEFLNTHFSPEIVFKPDSFEINSKKFGIFLIEKSNNKPIVCTKTINDKISEGNIYYRYNARSEKIKYPELNKIIEEYKNQERKAWENLIKDIATIGAQNTSLIDIYRGHLINNKNQSIVISKELLKEMKLVHEGRFVEKDGADALVIRGTIDGLVETVIPNIQLNEDFFTTKEIAEKLDLLSENGSTCYMQAIIWKYDIQKNNQFFQSKGKHKYYNKYCLDFLKDKNISLDKAKDVYKEYIHRNKN